MKTSISFYRAFTLLFTFTVMTFFGCEKKTDENETGNPPKAIIQDITGKWTGTFDGKSIVLDITEQTDSSFSGKIKISYRQPINQEVSGSFSPSTLKITMTDQLRSRFQGEYIGSLSKEADKFSGTFTLNNDGTRYSFNLIKGS